jgi:membrane protein required for colicin V production
MQLYDIVMIVVLAATTIFGFWKGMARQIASLAALVVSYFVAQQFSPQLAPLFGDEEPWNKFVAMFVLYVGTSLVIWFGFRFVSDAIERVQLKEFDRQMGGLFGFAKGVLLCVAITLFAVSLLPEEKRGEVLQSKSGHYIAVLLHRTHSVIPDELHDVLHPYLDRAEEELDPEAPPHPRDAGRPETPADAPAFDPNLGYEMAKEAAARLR